MKMIDLQCPHCGAALHVNNDENLITCKYCGQNFYLDDEVQHVQYDNAEQAGYEFERGRQRAQDERRASVNRSSASTRPASCKKSKKKRSPAMICLLVFLWLCFFPIMLSIWIWKTDRIKDKRVKYALLAVVWALAIIIWVTTDTSTTKDTSDTQENAAVGTESLVETIPTADTEKTEELPVLYDGDQKINRFLNAYNSANDEDIDMSDYSVYNHHGKEHKDQIISYGQDSQTVITHSVKGIKVSLKRGSIDEYKDAFKRFIKAYDASLDDETIDEYWNQTIDASTSITDIGDYEVQISKSTYSDGVHIDYIGIDGKID